MAHVKKATNREFTVGIGAVFRISAVRIAAFNDCRMYETGEARDKTAFAMPGADSPAPPQKDTIRCGF